MVGHGVNGAVEYSEGQGNYSQGGGVDGAVVRDRELFYHGGKYECVGSVSSWDHKEAREEDGLVCRGVRLGIPPRKKILQRQHCCVQCGNMYRYGRKKLWNIL